MMRFLGWDGYGIPVNNCGLDTAPETGASDPGGTIEQNPRDIAYNEIVHMIRGILASSRMRANDAQRLLDWSVRYAIDPEDWPAGAIAHRLARLCRQGSIATRDADDLKLLLDDIADNPQPVVAEPAAIPFTEPPPSIAFPNKHFVLVGHFVAGLADSLESVRLRGGRYDELVTEATDFLVIGALRSQEWVSNSIRAEVEAALKAVHRPGASATPVAIISEASFLRAIGECRIPSSTHSSAQSRSPKGVPEHASRF